MNSLATSPIDTDQDLAFVTIKHVAKTFKNGVVALDDINLEVDRGQFVSLLGPSGCGKSTLLRLLVGLLPYEGSIVINGELVDGPRADVGMMFQSPGLLPWKTALANVLLPRRIRHGRTTAGDEEAALDFLRLVGLEDFAYSFPRQLSGGMSQRVSIARLLMTGADVILLDEPFSALDEFTRERLNLELLRIHADRSYTTFFVTHNISESIFLADKVVVMSPRPGRVSAVIEVPFDRPREPALKHTPEFGRLAQQAAEILGRDQ